MLAAFLLGVFHLSACREEPAKPPVDTADSATTAEVSRSAADAVSTHGPSQEAKDQTDQPAAEVKKPVDLKEGKRLFYLRRCNTCHKTKGRLAMRGPSLAGVAKRLDREAMKGWILNPRRQKPDTIMPVFDGTDEELETILDFLLSLK